MPTVGLLLSSLRSPEDIAVSRLVEGLRPQLSFPG